MKFVLIIYDHPKEQFDWLAYQSSQLRLTKLGQRSLTERTLIQTSELCDEYSITFQVIFQIKLKSRVIRSFSDDFLILNDYSPKKMKVNSIMDHSPIRQTFELGKLITNN